MCEKRIDTYNEIEKKPKIYSKKYNHKEALFISKPLLFEDFLSFLYEFGGKCRCSSFRQVHLFRNKNTVLSVYVNVKCFSTTC